MDFKVVSMALAALALAPVVAVAQIAPAPGQACNRLDADLPADLGAWTTKSALTAATKAADLPQATLLPGQAVTAILHRTREVAYVTEPGKPGGSVASGGLFAVRIAHAATYRVVLSSGAWVDLLEGGRPVLSSAHSHGPTCTTARKIVDFPLKPGRHVLKISASADPTIGVLVLPRP